MGPVKYLKRKLHMEETKNVEWMLAEADKWREPTGPKYREEIGRRRNYLDGEMKADGLVLLKQEFPKTYEQMRYKMLQYPVAKHIWTKKAHVFGGKGERFYLVDANKGMEEIPSDSAPALDYAYLNESSENPTVTKGIDRALESMHCCAVRPTWSRDHIEDNIFDPDKCHIVVNPDHDNDPYAARAVLFERTGEDGVNDTEPRYEVWGARDPVIAAERDSEGQRLFRPDMHFITSAHDQWRVNEHDENPYRDRHTGEVAYPFTWYRDNRRSIYEKGGDDLVELTRVINMGLTYLHHNMIWQMAVLPVTEQPQGGGLDADAEAALKAIVLSSPSVITTKSTSSMSLAVFRR